MIEPGGRIRAFVVWHPIFGQNSALSSILSVLFSNAAARVGRGQLYNNIDIALYQTELSRLWSSVAALEFNFL